MAFKSLLENIVQRLTVPPLILGNSHVNPKNNIISLKNGTEPQQCLVTPFSLEGRSGTGQGPLSIMNTKSVSWNGKCLWGCNTEKQYVLKDKCVYMNQYHNFPLELNGDPNKPLSFSELPHGLMLHWQAYDSTNEVPYDWDHCWTPIFNQNYFKDGETNTDTFYLTLATSDSETIYFAEKKIRVVQFWDEEKKKYVATLQGDDFNQTNFYDNGDIIKFVNKYWVLTEAYII